MGSELVIARVRERRALTRYAVAVARGEQPDVVPPEWLPRLAHMLRHHGIAPLAYVRCRDDERGLASLLRPDLEQAVGRHLRTRSVLGRLLTSFAPLGHPWAVLKGPVLSELAHPVPGIRPYSDLDLLVPGRALRRALKLLQCEEWRLLDRNHRLVLERMPGELHLMSPDGVVVDLHWALLNGERTRGAFPVDVDGLLADRQWVRLGHHRVPTLAAEHLVVHTALHAAMSGADRLLYLLDVDGQVRRRDTDWDGVATAAAAWGAGPALAVVLERCRRVLSTPVPAGLSDRLSGSRAWAALISGVETVSPVARATGAGSLSRIVARASRPTSGESWTELLRRARARAARGQGGIPASVLDDRPDADALDRFLVRVEQQSANPQAPGCPPR